MLFANKGSFGSLSFSSQAQNLEPRFGEVSYAKKSGRSQ